MDMANSRAKPETASAVPDYELRKRCQKRRAALIQTRDAWLQDWMQVTDYIDPSRGRFNFNEGTGTPNERARNRRSRAKIINGTATRCVRVAVAGMSSHMTSKARPWFQLATPEPAMGELYDVRVWLDDVTQIIRDTLAKSNFYKAMPVVYTEDMMYGVAAMLILEDADEVVRFHPLTIGTYAIGLDNQGKVDSLWRSYRKTARQLEEKHGRAKLPPRVQQACQNAPDTYFTVESLIEKNPDARPGMGPFGIQAPQYRPWREVTWIQGTSNDAYGCLDVGGHYEAPFVTVRWNPVGDDTYSTSPCIDSLGDIKQLQYLEGQKLRLIDLTAEPPLGLPDTMKNMGSSLSPRAKLYLPQTQNGMKAEPLYSPPPQAVQQVSLEIRETESRIEDAHFYNLFLMMESLGDQTGRTATEIAERREEKAAVLGPTLESVTDEALDPTVVRTYKLLERAGRLPPAPEALDRVPLKIEYTSILAQAQKAAGLGSIERVIGFVAQLVQATGDQSKFDKIDMDQAIDEFSERVGGPATIVRSDEMVASIRTGRQQQEQRMQALAAAKPAADAANAIKTLGDSVPQDGSLGQQLAEQLSGGVPA